MKRIGIMGVMLFALALGSCDLLETKGNIEPVSRELSKDPEENNPDEG
jgi:hypothetical protein